MKQKVLALALLGMGICLAGAARLRGSCEDAIKTLTPVAEAGDAVRKKRWAISI